MDRVQLSGSECSAVVSALMECSHYCVSHCLTSDVSDTALCDYIVSDIVSFVCVRYIILAPLLAVYSTQWSQCDNTAERC